MIVVRQSNERGHTDWGWLDSRHTFSFGEYADSDHMGYRALRVINEDRVRPGGGFPTHPHRDMEIISIVLEGSLEHKDSMGNGSVIQPGDIQRMSAGTGITHSEFNHSSSDLVHFLQVWLIPDKRGLEPSYEQKSIPPEERRGALKLLASHDGRDGSVRVHQDASVYGVVLESGEEISHELQPDRHGWLQVARGSVTLNGYVLRQGDGASIEDQQSLNLLAKEPSEVILFDLG